MSPPLMRGSTTSVGGSRRTDLPHRTEVRKARQRIERPSTSRRRPGDRSPKASAGRNRGSHGMRPARRAGSRQPPHEATAEEDHTVGDGHAPREDFRRGRPPPRDRGPATAAAHLGSAVAHSTRERPLGWVTSQIPSPPTCRPRGSWVRCRHRNRARWFPNTSGCHPCRHGRRRDLLGSTPSGVPPGR